MAWSVLKSQFAQSANVMIAVTTGKVEMTGVAVTTGEVEMTGVVVMTGVAETTAVITEEVNQEVEIDSRIMTGIVHNAITQILPSEPNAICVACKKATVMAHLKEITTEVVMTKEAMITVEVEIIKTLIKAAIMIGIVHNAITQTLLSEPNAICAANLKVMGADLPEEMTDGAEMIDGVATTAEAAKTGLAGMITEVEIIETLISTAIMTGSVQNVKIQISHSEPNVICAPNQSAVAAKAAQKSGKAKTGVWATEEGKSRKEQEIGIALTVENPILPREMIALVAAVQKE